MNIYFKQLLLVAAVAGLFAPVSAMADFRDYADSKAWTNFGRDSSKPRAMSRSYRSNAPVIVRSESKQNAVAQAPTERRSFSYEPSQEAEQTHSGCGCGGSVSSDKAPETAQRSTETRRSFSYEPSTDSSTVQTPARSYSAPRMRSSRSSQTPLYMLPKTDPRKYRTH